MTLHLPKHLQARITKRCRDLDMSPVAYVKQCILSELTKSQRSTVTAGKDTPALSKAKKDYGCGKGYRWVGPWEVVADGDEFLFRGEWVQTLMPGEKCPETPTTYRRKL